MLDSAGGPLVAAFGRPSYAGSDTLGGLAFHWRSDSLCVSLYRPRSPSAVQISFTLPEFYGRCP